MNLSDFKSKLTILNDDTQNRLREKYIKTFINTTQNLYHEQIEVRKKYIDGYCYWGYLWDFLKDPIVIEKVYIEKELAKIGSRDVYVFWDINSCEHIHIKDYWKFEKDTMIKLSGIVLLEGLKFLPEDIYIFDDDLSWTLIYTHEDIDGVQYCLKSGEKEDKGTVLSS